MRTIEILLLNLRKMCSGLKDKRRRVDSCVYTMADIVMGAFSLFFMQSPSFLAHQKMLADGHGTSNCKTLFGMESIPSDNHIRQMLDIQSPDEFNNLFFESINMIKETPEFSMFKKLDDRILIAIDGTEFFRSSKISCSNCLKQQHSNGQTDFFHSFLGATIVAPGHNRVMPLPPEFITPQDGYEKQDCERAAAKRWLATHGARLLPFRPIYLGDDLFACQPIVEDILKNGGSFILTCKASSHKTISDHIQKVTLKQHCQIINQPGKKSTFVYRWTNKVPIRSSKDTLIVNWFSVEILNKHGKRTYYNSYITDMNVNENNVSDMAACGRARWKIENETFNVLKNGGYNLEHNYGHGKHNLANVFVVLNLLAFLFHTVAQISSLAWRNAITARGAFYRLFEHLRTITAYIIFSDWDSLLCAIANPKTRPP